MATILEKPDVMTAQELAEFLRIPEDTVRRLAARFAIPGRQIEKEWRFSRRAVEDWLRGGSGKEVLLSQAGAFADDAQDMQRLRDAVYEERGRPSKRELSASSRRIERQD
jgi:excisionase family DNA binding protein